LGQKSKQKKWTVMISAGAKEPVKQFQLRKTIAFGSIGLVLALVGLIGGLVYVIDQLQTEQRSLNNELNEREQQIASLHDENLVIYQEATAVQETVEEFKQVEERLGEIQLNLPSDPDKGDDDGSGGLELDNRYNGETELAMEGVHGNLVTMKEQLPHLIANFEKTVSALIEYEETLKTVPTFFPAEGGRISSEFGSRKDPFTSEKRFHSGTDVAAPLETSIYAAADGEVILSGPYGGYGNTVIIKHGDTYETLYAHLNSIEVSMGDNVKKGDYIAGMGTTGRSTGVHLHFEIKRNGELVDPYNYMTFHKLDDEVGN